MEDDHIEQYEGKNVSFKKYFKHRVVNASELTDVLEIATNKSTYQMLRNGIPKESIVIIPVDKRGKVYYLKREGIVAFINKYKPEKTESFMKLFDTVVEKEQNEDVKEEKELKMPESGDPYALDLLEDILHKIEQMNKDAQRFYVNSMTMYTRQAVLFLEAEALYSKVAAILLKAESMGPISRLNKELTKDMITLGKEAFSDAMTCEEALKEYDDFGKDEENAESNETDSNYNSATDRLLLRADKKHKDNRKRSQ